MGQSPLFLLLIFSSVIALLATFLIAASSLSFSYKVIVFLIIIGVYLAAISFIYRNQSCEIAEPVVGIEIETAQSENLEPESVFSPEVNEKLLALEEANAIFSMSLKPADMFRLVANRIAEIVPFSTSALYLAINKEFLKVKYASGKGASQLVEIETPSDAGLAGQSFQSRQTQTDDALTFEKLILPVGVARELKSGIACPLSRETESYGVLVLYSENEGIYDEKSVALFDAIGERISPLFLSSITFENNLNNALVDSLTALPNERALFLVLENQIAESQRQREQRPLSVLSIDIKGFAELNNRYGHASVDRILVFAAQKIKEQLRQMDFLARVQSDEFLVVLPTSSDKTTEMIIERIEKAFAAAPYILEGAEISIQMNFGQASFITDGETSQDLLKIARVRRHEAKSPVRSTILWFPKEYSN